MILFKEDWNKYPDAIVDYQTDNRSFINLAAIYKKMGVSNHTFILALHNPELQGVDPHSESLTEEQMLMIGKECYENPWYFFREVARAPSLAGSEDRPFNANRGNIAAYWLFFNHVMYILIQPRQTGKSFSIDELMTLISNIGATGTSINLLTLNDDLRTKNLKRLKSINETLPSYLNLRTKADIFNTEEFHIGVLGNSYKGNLSNASPKLAEKTGRGFTSPILHCDEPSYIPNIQIALTAALMAGNAAREIAKENDSFYGTILTTTAGKKDDKDGAYVYNLLQASAIMNEKYYDSANQSDLIDIILKNVKSVNGIRRPIVDCTFSYRQLGYDDKWMQDQLQETLAEGLDADRDLFNVWTSGSNLSPIDVRYLELIKESIEDDFRLEIYKPYNYTIRWYISEAEVNKRVNAGHVFIMGIDTSESVGRDDNTIVIRDILSGEIIAATEVNETNIIMFYSFIYDLMINYPTLIAVIERKSTGVGLIDFLLMKLVNDGFNPFTRLYNTVVQGDKFDNDTIKDVTRYSVPSRDQIDKFRKYFGFSTSASGASSRDELFSTVLMSSCKYTGRYVKDRKVAAQILALEVRNNRVDHPIGGHDDLVVSWLLTYWFMLNGKNLQLYGIDSNKILRNSQDRYNEQENSEYVNPDERADMEDVLEDLLEEFTVSRSEHIKIKLEHRIKKTIKILNEVYKSSISLDDVMKTIDRENVMQQTRMFR